MTNRCGMIFILTVNKTLVSLSIKQRLLIRDCIITITLLNHSCVLEFIVSFQNKDQKSNCLPPIETTTTFTNAENSSHGSCFSITSMAFLHRVCRMYFKNTESQVHLWDLNKRCATQCFK